METTTMGLYRVWGLWQVCWAVCGVYGVKSRFFGSYEGWRKSCTAPTPEEIQYVEYPWYKALSPSALKP